MNIHKNLITDLYIALKTKPLAILAGTKDAGKEVLVEKLTQALSTQGIDKLQFQTLTGHAWWATGNMNSFVEIQTRFTFDKVVSIFEEVQLPQNSDKAFLVCLAHISPAEIQTFFADLAFQIQNNRIMRLGDIHFGEPVAFPKNLFIIGTMDTDEYRWWDTDLLSKTSVIQTGKYDFSQYIAEDTTMSINVPELISPIRDSNMAYKRLKSLLSGEKQPFGHFLQIQEIMHNYNISASNKLMDDVVIYLANAWSSNGKGLFASEPRANFEIATDILIAQLLLPYVQDVLLSSQDFRQTLHQVLHLYYPCSCEYLGRIM